MYINTVVGAAFGPLREESLKFATGLNVVHGPNEAGKSSWFNATYAALAGRRKYKGKGSAAETEYKNRNKPWSGSKWVAALVVTLDDGRTLAIEQDLAKGEWQIVDAKTARGLSDTDWLTDGSLDGTKLLGLNRHSARATIFTGQADILRVRDDAGALQELLEKAASTGAADASADAALGWLKERRSEWVGVAHIGSKPLRTSHTSLTGAQALAETRRDDLSELLETIGNRQKLAPALTTSRAEVELGERLMKWRSVYELRGRVERAGELADALAKTNKVDLEVDEAQLAAATKVLVVFDGGTDVAPLGEGLTAADLQVQIDQLPRTPEGDLEPRSEIVEARAALDQAQTALDTHLNSAPPDVAPPSSTILASDELRTLADILASTPPEVDTVAVAEFEQTRGERAAQIAALQREVDEHDAAYRRLKAEYDSASNDPVSGTERTALHNAERSRADALIAVTRRLANFLLESLSAQEVQAGVMAQDVALRQHRERVGAARTRVLAESLEPSPEGLKRMARAIDDAGAARKIAAQHADRAAEFRASRDDRLRALTRLLGEAAHVEVADDVVAQTLQVFVDYVDACKARAEVAQQAARRPDLVAAQIQRQQLEAAHQQALVARESQGRDVVEFARTVGLEPESLEAAADGLRRWARRQEVKREAFTKQKTDVALLEQLLGGRELDEWKSDLAIQMANAGDEPAVPMPLDLNAFAADAKSRHDRAINLDGQLKGRIQTLGNDLGSVAEAVEAEADALRAVTQVELLASCLSAATDELMNAKERANASIAPALADRMRPWLPKVTNGRYRDVTVDPSDLTMQVTETRGQVRQADRLSMGTTEQIYLLLRVTLSQVLSGGVETAPLIFDDVTTQSDAVRTVAVMEMLHELSTAHQVILFTQEDEVLAWARENVDPARDKIIQLVAP
ncbi:chromosome segregation protein SMC [Mycolicibacterium sp. P1-18]|uniref:AAA family ATPase n=1 Tax=Mycolicibacterium sp. P1-18 TaxID=2024615 RepID=UPI0011F0D7A5|nr:AAA family ATPase [Mycolicibacterium sp. P1-18]KAA0098899.1 chromosome segregation protein SMC [Mycolicibacterium sp. P1-18]